MNRDNRDQLVSLTEDFQGSIELAESIKRQRSERARLAKKAEAQLRSRVVEINHNRKVAWRVIPLRAQDGDLLRAIAHYAALPSDSPLVREALADLTTSVPEELAKAQTLHGVRRFFVWGRRRREARDAAKYLVEYREWFHANRLPEKFKVLLSALSRRHPDVALRDALTDGAGLAARLHDLGASRELVSARSFDRLATAAERVQGVATEEAGCRAAAIKAGQELRHAETARILAGLGLDRLRGGTTERIRTGPLHDAGLRTVKAVLDYKGLNGLPGISASSASRILGAAKASWQDTYDEMPAKIDAKNRSAESTELLRRVRIWDSIRKNGGSAGDVELARQLGKLARVVDESASFFIVFAAPSGTLDSFHASVDVLVQRGRLIADGVDTSRRADPWTDFLSRPADYFALFDELGFITEDEAKAEGDLPDDIIAAIRAFELKTEHLKASLRGYQSFGARFALVQRRVIIGDEMGLGKTIEAIAVLAHLCAKGKRHFLVICPAAVVTNWMREVTSKSTLRAHRLHGYDRKAAAMEWRAVGGVAVTTYESLKWLHLEFGGVDDDLACVIVDEAHYIKNRRAQRTQNTLQLLTGCDHALLLTGTPLENRIDEFQNLVSYVQPKLAVDANESTPRAFRRQVAPAYLRRNQEDVLKELPDQVEVDEWLPMSAEDTNAYRAAVEDGNFMAMRQAGMTQGEKSQKMQRLFEIVEEAEDNGRRVVVFSYFREVLDQVAQSMPGRVFGPLTGSVSPVRRQAMVDQFSGAGDGAVLVAQVVAGGVGLNIQAASVVVICEPQLKPTTEWQAIARARRMGQLESVQVHRLLSEDTVDQRIREILARKTNLFEEFARESELATSTPDALDVTDADLARQVVAAEQARLFGKSAASEDGVDRTVGSGRVATPPPSTVSAPAASKAVRAPQQASMGVRRQAPAARPTTAGGRAATEAKNDNGRQPKKQKAETPTSRKATRDKAAGQRRSQQPVRSPFYDTEFAKKRPEKR